MACRELQRIHVIEVAKRIASHHHVHLSRANQEGVEVGTKQVVGGEVGQPVSDGDELFRVLVACLDVLLFVEGFIQVVQGLDQEAARTAGRIEHALMLFGCQHLDHKTDGATRGEVLASISTQVGADDLLVGRTLGVHIGAAKVVAGKF
ncbi:hypothetical protein D9M69_540150 [compost metagenome]